MHLINQNFLFYSFFSYKNYLFLISIFLKLKLIIILKERLNIKDYKSIISALNIKKYKIQEKPYKIFTTKNN
jgi:hypothetical protein